MQHISKFLAPLIALLLVSSVGTAQNIQLTKGYYINLKGEKTAGFFDLEYLRDNQVKIWSSQTDSKGKTLDIADVEKVVLERENNDSLVLLTQTVTFREQPEKIYLEYLLRGDVNLLRGVSKLEKDIFFIYSTDLPKVRRINGVHPKTFLFAYFPKCDEVKKKMTKEIPYERKDLEQAITQLANCGNPNQKSSELPKTKSVKDATYGFKRYLSFGVTGTGGYAFPSMDKFEGTTFTGKTFLTGFGFNAQINLTNRLSYSVAMHSGFVEVTAKDILTKSLRPDGNTTFRFKGKPTIGYFRADIIPIEIKYRFIRSKQKLEPVMTFGAMLNRTVTPLYAYEETSYERVVDNSSLPSTNTVPNTPSLRSLSGNRGFGGFVTVGLQRQFNKNLALSLGMKYTFSNDIIVVPPIYIDEREKELFNSMHRIDVYAHFLFTLK